MILILTIFQVGNNYLCPEWKQELITFVEFLERIRSNDTTSVETMYLAQHQLFDQIQELRQDIVIPDYCFTGGGEIRSLNAWFGPAGIVTPLHHEPHHNILAQRGYRTDANLPDMPIVFASDTFLKLIGFSKDEVLGYNCRSLSMINTDSSSQFWTGLVSDYDLLALDSVSSTGGSDANMLKSSS
ncbi:Lysine-specific demethylase 8 [Capsicum chinense]|nr:Lysine-specific demethylase 8 [Capsicum chinense]